MRKLSIFVFLISLFSFSSICSGSTFSYSFFKNAPSIYATDHDIENLNTPFAAVTITDVSSNSINIDISLSNPNGMFEQLYFEFLPEIAYIKRQDFSDPTEANFFLSRVSYFASENPSSSWYSSITPYSGVAYNINPWSASNIIFGMQYSYAQSVLPSFMQIALRNLPDTVSAVDLIPTYLTAKDVTWGRLGNGQGLLLASPVPIPSALFLFISGIAGFLALRKNYR
ncbi:hypothetical protein ACH5Y9_24480 [Methylomonas sp. BW4-1]|uniref:hypothetical protein n=1 Tax=Methylomonas sp. BW4-1 TaxID=3376685 RepID=UPI0040436B31